MGRAMVQALNVPLVQGAPESRQRRKVRAPIRVNIGRERKSAAGLARLASALGGELQRATDAAESSSARAAKSEEKAAQACVVAAAQKEKSESLLADLAQSREESAELTEQLSRLRGMRGMDAAGYKAVAEDLKGRATRLYDEQRNGKKRSIREFARLEKLLLQEKKRFKEQHLLLTAAYEMAEQYKSQVFTLDDLLATTTVQWEDSMAQNPEKMAAVDAAVSAAGPDLQIIEAKAGKTYTNRGSGSTRWSSLGCLSTSAASSWTRS